MISYYSPLLHLHVTKFFVILCLSWKTNLALINRDLTDHQTRVWHLAQTKEQI